MDRVIRLIDVARAIAHAGSTPVCDGASVTSIELELRTLSAGIPAAAGIWGMLLRYPPVPRIGLLARWRRARRRRAGIGVARILLRWTPPHLDALVDGRPVARLDFTAVRGGSDEHPAQA